MRIFSLGFFVIPFIVLGISQSDAQESVGKADADREAQLVLSSGPIGIPFAGQQFAPAVAEKKIGIKKRATVQVHGKYQLTLYEQPKQMAFIFQDRLLTPVWAYYWIDVRNLETGKTRLVWSIYHSLFAQDPQRRSRGFTFGVGDEETVALVSVQGKEFINIHFHEIDLTEVVEATVPFDQPSRPGAAYTFPTGISAIGSQIPYFKMLSPIYGKEKVQTLFAKTDARIKEVAWSERHWKVTVDFGEKEFTFVRQEDGAKWQLEQ